MAEANHSRLNYVCHAVAGVEAVPGVITTAIELLMA